MNEEQAQALIPAEALKLAEYSATAAGLADRGRLANVVYDLTSAKGMEAARTDRRECVKLRTSLEALRVQLKAPALERSRLIDSEAKALTAAILALETPIDEAIQTAEREKAAAKEAKERAERERVAALRERLAALWRFPAAEALNLNAEGAARVRAELEATGTDAWLERHERTRQTLRARIAEFEFMADVEYHDAASMERQLLWFTTTEPVAPTYGEFYEEALAAWRKAYAALGARAAQAREAEEKARQAAETAAMARQEQADRERREAAESERQAAAERASELRRARLVELSGLRKWLGTPERALGEIATICAGDLTDADAREKCLAIADAFLIQIAEEGAP